MALNIAFRNIAYIALGVLAKIIQLWLFRFSIKDIKLPKETATVSSEPKENEILNKKIDEIVYFFEETRFRIVFFEDLDRFNNPAVFVKLREINTLLNNYDAIKENVVFVYAIKDEVFTDAERTKFFDFILPVIPVINSTNSGETFLKLLQVEGGVSRQHNITQEFIFDVSPFISDMRVLYNIHNEFLLYKQTIKLNQGLTTLDDRIMMSLIIFKNLQPDQFALLQNEEGLVKEAFSLKTSFVVKRKLEIRRQIDAHTQVLNSIDDDTLNSQYELKCAMLCAIADWEGLAYYMTRNGSGTIYGSNVLEDDFDISRLLESGQWNIKFSGANGTNSPLKSNIKVPEICAPYVERLKYLQYSGEEEKRRRKEEVARLEAESRVLSTLSLQELIEKFGSKCVFTKEKDDSEVVDQVYENELLEFMLRKGYINEEYANYINFFKGNSMTVADMNFIMSIKTQKPKPFTYELSISKLPQIISKLQTYEFAERAILNFDLLEHMLSCHAYDDKLAIFVQQLSDEAKDSWEFIDEFIDKTKQQKRFIKLLTEAWPKLWDDIYENPILTYDRKLHYLTMLCSYLNNEQLSAINADGLVTKFFVDNEDILQKLSTAITERIKDIIPTLDIYFCKLDITGVPQTLLDYVFDNCYYELNPDMIHSIVAYKDASLCNSLNSKNYSTILKLGYVPLLEYVHKNFGTYVDRFVLQEDNTEETVQSVLEMLDRSIDDMERCNRIITHINFVLDSVTEVCSKHIDDNSANVQVIWNTLLSKAKVKVSWNVICGYWKTYGLTAELLNYIEDHDGILSEQDASCLDDDFKKSVILSPINDAVFCVILPCVRMDTFDIGIDEISKEKLNMMVQSRSFAFTTVDYGEMSQYAPKLCAQFILHNQQEFAEKFDEITLTADVFEALILHDDCLIPIKERILARYGADLMTGNVANYLPYGTIAIDRNIFTSAWELVDDTRIQNDLVFRYMDILELEDFERCLTALGDPYEKLERKAYRHEEIIPDNEMNRALVSRLRFVQYLTSVEYEKQTLYNPQREIPVIRCRVKAKPTTV